MIKIMVDTAITFTDKTDLPNLTRCEEFWIDL